MHESSILQSRFYMVKVVHRLVCTYMCVHVIPCACVFKFADVFVYGEGCT